MLYENTPIKYCPDYDLYVKREDLSCPPPGPPFSKTRGVYARVKSRREIVIGALDTYHSQAGHAVARACQILSKKCLNFYPVYKREGEPIAGGHELRDPQLRSLELGAEMRPLQAGRSCILFHAARKATEGLGGYMMPNALKLEESVEETAKEVPRHLSFDYVLIAASSGTIAAGVIKGFADRGEAPTYLIHLGYSRSHEQVLRYLEEKSGYDLEGHVQIVDEGYSYKDVARGSIRPSFPCNEYYDLKAFQWWLENRPEGKTLFWNVG